MRVIIVHLPISGLKKVAGSWLQRMGNKNEKDAGIADVFLW